MHIADMTMFYAPSSGGVRTYLDAKRRRLHEVPGIRHSLLVPGARYRRHDHDRLVEVPAPPLPFSNGYRFPLRRRHWIRALRDVHPDLIEAGDPYVTGWAAARAGRELDIPVVGFYHSDLPLLVSNRFGDWTSAGIGHYISRLYGHYARVLAPSRVMAGKLHALGLEEVHVQPLGVDLVNFSPERRSDEVRRELGISDETRLLIFAGRGSREKNVDVLLETMKQLGSGYHLLLVGSCMPEHTPDNVTVINHFCSADELAVRMASSDALLHAGTQETFGLVVLEAMACGIPVVVANAGALGENVPEECGLLCEPHNAASMTEAVRNLFAADSQRLGRQARAHVERHHNWDSVVDGLGEHYRSVLGIRETGTAGVQHG
ncbi:alpha-1,6-mannosyltransferase [Kushneria sinocarnis]|uniref:Alpha-1,6-mannosyltransferase n=1 Tax=Kushneria sinocarnis TaxID=595502 RepID=A0A420WUE4_9GAMM|nr:glycosyltransferase family 1 protein [Kushneria sinocarnis]RKQ97066.1 alpha-1,6-mannosyltransferase [Kushneria sinocarnis]